MLRPENIIRCNRKTLSLYVNAGGELVVKAPVKLPERKIFEFVKSKEDWIRTQQERVKQNSYINQSVRCYRTFYFLGQELTPLISTKCKKISKNEGLLLIPEKFAIQGDDVVLKKVEKWLRDNAKLVIEERSLYFS